MSVQATTWVWEHSESGGNARLVLLAIADAADADGNNAWPTQSRIAGMARVSIRTVRRLVAELIMLGELEMEEHAGGTAAMREDRRPHLYRLPKMSTGGHKCPPGKRRSAGGQAATNGRTSRDERADTVVPITSFSLNTQEKNPSGGLTAAAARPSLESPPPIHDEEEPVSKPVDNLTLFDVPATSSRDEKKPESPSAKTVVAAFVESYRLHHAGVDPAKSVIGRVGRDAKALLGQGAVGPDELAEAARAMGETAWSNLPVALNIHRDRGRKAKGRQSPVAILGPDHPVWVEVAREEETRTYQRILTDDTLVEWIAGDPSEVDKWVTKYPELAARFGAVA